jgi:hypothetical protein
MEFLTKLRNILKTLNYNNRNVGNLNRNGYKATYSKYILVYGSILTVVGFIVLFVLSYYNIIHGDSDIIGVVLALVASASFLIVLLSALYIIARRILK